MPYCFKCLLPEPGLGRIALSALFAVPYWFLTFSEWGSSVCAHHHTLLVPHPCQVGNLMCAHISAPLSLHKASMSVGTTHYVISSLCKDGATPVHTLLHFACSAPFVGRTAPCVSGVVPYYFRTFSEKGRSVCGYHSSLLTPHSLQEGESCVHMQLIGCAQQCPSVPARSVSILQNPLFRSYGTLLFLLDLVLREEARYMLQ